MPAPFQTLLLDVATWDLTADASGNIAVADPPYAVAQDVASAQRTFLNEVYYDNTLGMPWLQQIAGMTPQLSVFTAALERVALTVPGTVTATASLQSYANEQRQATGSTTVTDVSGNSLQVGV